MSVRLFLAGAALAAIAMPASAAELVTNGGFSNGTSVDATGWTRTIPSGTNVQRSSDTIYGGNTYYTGSTGNAFMSFGMGNLSQQATVSQTLAGSTGLTTVTFDGGMFNQASTLQHIVASVTDLTTSAVLASYTANINTVPYGNSWADLFSTYGFTYNGTGNNVSLAFTAFGDGNGGDSSTFDLFLDNVSAATSQAATDVPEPATWAMMIGGFGMVGAAMRRRAKVAFA